MLKTIATRHGTVTDVHSVPDPYINGLLLKYFYNKKFLDIEAMRDYYHNLITLV